MEQGSAIRDVERGNPSSFVSDGVVRHRRHMRKGGRYLFVQLERSTVWVEKARIHDRRPFGSGASPVTVASGFRSLDRLPFLWFPEGNNKCLAEPGFAFGWLESLQSVLSPKDGNPSTLSAYVRSMKDCSLP